MTTIPHTTLLDTLVDCRALITPPENFTKNAYAKDTIGIPVSATDKSATCFCLLGSAMRVIGYNPNCRKHVDGNQYVMYSEVVVQLQRQLRLTTDISDEYMGVARYSDSSTHEEVMTLLDNTIARLKLEAQP